MHTISFHSSPKLSILSDCISYGPEGGDATQGQVAAWEYATGITPSCLTEIRTNGQAVLGITRIIEASHAACAWPLAKGVPVRRIIFCNIAPRGSEIAQQYTNGTPFCYVQIGNCLLLSTYTETVLAQLSRFCLIESVRVIESNLALLPFVERGVLTERQYATKQESQFRSKDLVPDLVALLIERGELDGEDVEVRPGSEEMSLLGWDEHGNGKTNVFTEDIGHAEGKSLTVSIAGKNLTVPCFNQLRSVPTGALALVRGSHRIGTRALLELVVAGGSAKVFLERQGIILESGDGISVA